MDAGFVGTYSDVAGDFTVKIAEIEERKNDAAAAKLDSITNIALFTLAAIVPSVSPAILPAMGIALINACGGDLPYYPLIGIIGISAFVNYLHEPTQEFFLDMTEPSREKYLEKTDEVAMLEVQKAAKKEDLLKLFIFNKGQSKHSYSYRLPDVVVGRIGNFLINLPE